MISSYHQGVALSTLHTNVNRLRICGSSDDDIARAVGVSLQVVRNVPLPKPNVQRSRAVQHMQLQVMASKLMPAVEQGDRDAMLTMMKIQKREADLLGLDAPKEVVSHNFNTNMDIEGMTPEQLRELSTEELKLIVLRQASHEATDITPDAPPSST